MGETIVHKTLISRRSSGDVKNSSWNSLWKHKHLFYGSGCTPSLFNGRPRPLLVLLTQAPPPSLNAPGCLAHLAASFAVWTTWMLIYEFALADQLLFFLFTPVTFIINSLHCSQSLHPLLQVPTQDESEIKSQEMFFIDWHYETLADYFIGF